VALDTVAILAEIDEVFRRCGASVDLLHEQIPESYVQDVFEVMGRAHWHTFQILTKRHERLVELASPGVALAREHLDGREHRELALRTSRRLSARGSRCRAL